MLSNQHEKNYSPSQWSKRYGPDEVMVIFGELAKDATERARSGTACQLDVPYGPTNRTKYDIYGTDLPKDAPIFVFIHGGYWQELDKSFSGFSVLNLVAKGIKVIAVGYDLCPQVTLTNIVSQIKSAVEQILKSARDSGSRCVWVAGHSAGAHLSVSLIYDKEWINRMKQENCFQLLKGLMLIGGIYGLRPLLDTSFNAPLNLTEDEIKAFSFTSVDVSPNENIQGIKVIVTVGECDSPVFVEESREISRKLISVVDNVEYVLLRDSVDHFNIVENLVYPDFILIKKIVEQMTTN